MTFISYAQNLEDIVMWRLFRLCAEIGFYIDVGANDPVEDSVTKAFYDRGWRGVNIDPSPKYYERLCTQRIRDINIQAAISDQEGMLTFYDADDGWSTVNPDVAVWLRKDGKQIVERSISAQTLNTICERYVTGEIHFLKIDVEGHECSVLRGMDFEKWRPWIVLIESPLHIEFPEWEHLLLDARYHLVRRDGINRFYLVEERTHLKGAFDMPPSLLDDFQLCYGHRFSFPVADLEAQLAYERNRADLAEAKLVALDENTQSLIQCLRQVVRNWLRKIKKR